MERQIGIGFSFYRWRGARLGEESSYYRAEEMELSIRRLHRVHLPIDTAKLARFLIGKTLVHDLREGRLSGRIVETEAYVVGDAAGHAYRGPTPRNKSLFLDRGHAYVYRAYGLHFLVNVSSEVRGVGAGVLLRALEPLDGIQLMRLRRAQAPLIDLARGPGRLAQAMGIGLRHDGLDLCAAGSLWLGDSVRPMGNISRSARIGVSRETQRLLRFYERGSPYISGSKRSTA
jgi:DNA-3-methyladenine glycosylase